jgi:hypothetical protein
MRCNIWGWESPNMLACRISPIVAGCALLATVVFSPLDSAEQEITRTCRVTQPGDAPFVPFKPYPGYFYFGTTGLWTSLPVGPWVGLPHSEEGYRQKVVWWSQGYYWRENHGQADILISGRRLDAPAPPLLVDPAASGTIIDGRSAMMSGVTFPTTGCWEIVGQYKGQRLKFVVRLAQ